MCPTDKLHKTCCMTVSLLSFTSIGSLRNPERLESWMGVVMKNIALHYLSQNNMVNTIPLSEMSKKKMNRRKVLSWLIWYRMTG